MANPIDRKMLIGTIGELLVQLRLLQYEVQAAPPVKDSGNDLVALRGRQVKLIQVRTTTKKTFPRLPAKKKIYDLLAVVYLDGHDKTLNLDRTDIFLIPKADLSAVPRTPAALEAYKLENVVKPYFQGADN